MTTRRQFLKTGLAGGLLLNIAGCSMGASGDSRRAVLSALVPVFLAGALPAPGAARDAAITGTVAGIEKAIAGLALAAQKELDQLFALLGFAPARIAVAGVWADWQDATPQAVGAFLESWRHSRFELLRSAYAALHDLVFGAFYAGPETWPAIGYPGPPKVQ